MQPNTVKRTLKEGGTVIGTMVFEFCTPGVARLSAEAGAEFIMYDMEHTGWSVETVRDLIATTNADHIEPLVRVPATQYHFIARVLDVGARGVMVPMVGDARQAEIIVQSGKYPPMGQRGAAFEIAHDHYAPGSVVAKIDHANEEGLLIAQIENRPGLENVDRIAALDGIDVLWIGGFDLSNFLGIPGQFDHPEFTAALERVVAACERHGKAAGYLVNSIEEGQLRRRQGFRCVAYGGDLWLYRRALREGIEGLSRRTY